jgi:hypothetical protein
MLNPGNKRAGRINHVRRALFQLALDLRRDAVRADDSRRPGIGFRRRTDGRHTFGFEPLHLLRVVNQRAERANLDALRERVFDHIHGALHAETETVFFSQQDFHFAFRPFPLDTFACRLVRLGLL